MTMIDKIEMTCSLCKNTSEQPILLSSNQFGYQDLDTRPSEMYRSTMETWILECPHCGYVAESLDEESTVDMEFLNSEEYRTCDAIKFKSRFSKIFYKKYLIEAKNSDDINSFFAILQCAWTCDDAEDLKNAKLSRQTAITIAEKIIESEMEDTENFVVIKADLLRRCGEFERLIKEYENITLNNEMLDNIIRFQVEKAHEEDLKCHTLEDVL